jgi:hypothetical protein
MSKPSAGLVHAPPFDPQSEIDPLSAPAPGDTSGGDDLGSLAYYKEQHDRQTLRARAALLSVIFVMLAGNMVLTWQTKSEVMANLDQTRLDQDALSEIVQTRVVGLETQLIALQAQLAVIESERHIQAATD